MANPADTMRRPAWPLGLRENRGEPGTRGRCPASLRAVLGWAMTALAFLSLVAAVSLIVFTSALHRAVTRLDAASQSVLVAERLEVALLTVARTVDPVVRQSVVGEIQELFAEAARHVGSEEERQLLERARGEVSGFVRALAEPAPEAERRLGRAFAELEALVQLNLEQARGVRERVARWDRAADVIGVTAALLLVFGVAAVLLWVQSVAIRPLLRAGEAMHRFGKGEREVRVPPSGPAEVREMAQQFNLMADSLAEQRSRQLAFLGGVAHDLRTPLAALRTAAAIVRPDQPIPEEARLRKAMSLLDRQVERLDRMLGDFLDAARIEAGQLELRLGAHDLRELSRAVAELFATLSPAHPLELRLPAEPVVAWCDAARLEQVLTNLVSNAVKYSPGGAPVVIALQARPGLAELSVIDRGIGIGPEELPRIFEPFRRIGAGRLTAPGVGLGLSVARRIVEAHRGRIEVASRVGEGSTFTVILPLQDG